LEGRQLDRQRGVDGDNDGHVEVAKAARGDKGWYGMPLRATAAGTPDTDGISDAITPAPR
jgi:hypothetical protein